jgi:hypothetical protein
MVLRHDIYGTPYREPPYTQKEQDEMWKQLSHGVQRFSRPSAPAAAPPQPEPQEESPSRPVADPVEDA